MLHRRVEEIQATKAPQVLKIDHDHDDAISVSDDESIVSDEEDEVAVNHTETEPTREKIITPSSHGWYLGPTVIKPLIHHLI